MRSRNGAAIDPYKGPDLAAYRKLLVELERSDRQHGHHPVAIDPDFERWRWQPELGKYAHDAGEQAGIGRTTHRQD